MGQRADDLAELAHCHRKVDRLSDYRYHRNKRKDNDQGNWWLPSLQHCKYNLSTTEGNLNNHIGVPLTLRLTHDHEMAVIEMGASHPSDIKELVDIAQPPNYGIITNVGRAHLEGFGSFEGVDQKQRVNYTTNKRRTKGKIFINQINKYLKEIANESNRSHRPVPMKRLLPRCSQLQSHPTFEWRQQGKKSTVGKPI